MLIKKGTSLFQSWEIVKYLQLNYQYFPSIGRVKIQGCLDYEQFPWYSVKTQYMQNGWICWHFFSCSDHRMNKCICRFKDAYAWEVIMIHNSDMECFVVGWFVFLIAQRYLQKHPSFKWIQVIDNCGVPCFVSCCVHSWEKEKEIHIQMLSLN